MKKKLNLKEFKVKSFVTELESEKKSKLNGGLEIQTGTNGCTALSCGIAGCTRDILNCF